MWLDHSEPSILLRDAGSTCIVSDIFFLRSRILKTRTAPLVFLLRFLGRGWDGKGVLCTATFMWALRRALFCWASPSRMEEEGRSRVGSWYQMQKRVGTLEQRTSENPSRGGAERMPNRKDAAKESGVTLPRRFLEVLFPPYRSWMRSNAQPRAAAVALTGQWSATTNADTEPRS
jgi:hypothetical protein